MAIHMMNRPYNSVQTTVLPCGRNRTCLMSNARVSCRKTASVPWTIGSIRTVALWREDRSRLWQWLALSARASFVDRTLGYVERLDHTLVVAIGGVVAADMPAAWFLYDVGVGQTCAALELGVVRGSEEAFGDARRSVLAITLWMYQRDEEWKNHYQYPQLR